MNDLIDRQSAIDALKTCQTYLFDIRDPDKKICLESAVYELEQLPTAQPQKVCVAEIKLDIDDIKDYIDKAIDAERWIPCSERLPDIGEHHVSEPCIVYCSNGAYGFAGLEENIFGQVGWNCERDDEYHEPLGEVLAWMPLPEPYKGEQE